MLLKISGEFRVDVREHESKVIVAADLPGVGKEAVSPQLLHSPALEISCERTEDKEEKSGGFSMRERMSGSMSRVVALPSDVMEEGAKATFRNGVLEVTLKKASPTGKRRITIE